MARTTLTVSDVSRSGVKQTLVAPAAVVDGNLFPNTGREVLVWANGDSGAHTITIQTPGTVDNLAVAERSVIIPAGETWYIGPFPPGTYNQADRSVYVDAVSSITSQTCCVIRI